jgi:hypothetical protein
MTAGVAQLFDELGELVICVDNEVIMKADRERDVHDSIQKWGTDPLRSIAYFFVGVLDGVALAWVAIFTGFIGAPQHTTSHSEQPQASSTTMTTPQVLHSYLSPFFVNLSSPLSFLHLALF